MANVTDKFGKQEERRTHKSSLTLPLSSNVTGTKRTIMDWPAPLGTDLYDAQMGACEAYNYGFLHRGHPDLPPRDHPDESEYIVTEEEHDRCRLKRKRRAEEEEGESLKRSNTSDTQQAADASHDDPEEAEAEDDAAAEAGSSQEMLAPTLPIVDLSHTRVVRPSATTATMPWETKISNQLKKLLASTIDEMPYATMKKTDQPSVKCKSKMIDQKNTRVIQFGFNQNARSLCSESQGVVTIHQNMQHTFNDTIQEVVDQFVNDHGCIVVWQTHVAPCTSRFQSNKYAPDQTEGVGKLDDETLFGFEGAAIHDEEGKAYTVIAVKHENKEFPIIAKNESGSTFRFTLENMLGTKRKGIAPPIDATDLIQKGDIFHVHTVQGWAGHPANPAFWQVTSIRETDRKEFVHMRPIARKQVCNSDARTGPCSATETNWVPVRDQFIGREEIALESYNKHSDCRYRHRAANNLKEASYPFYGSFLSDRRPFLRYFDPLTRQMGVSSWEVLTPSHPPPKHLVDPISHLGRL